jgi:predicted transcriptional regulator
MDGLYRHGPSTVAEILAFIPQPPGYSAVRALLRTLEEKGHVRHSHHGTRYVYSPVAERHDESRLALRHVVQTFFGGSASSVVAALLNDDEAMKPDDLAKLRALIASTKKEGR